MKTETLLILGAVGVLGYLAYTAKAEAQQAAAQAGQTAAGTVTQQAPQGLFEQVGSMVDSIWKVGSTLAQGAPRTA